MFGEGGAAGVGSGSPFESRSKYDLIALCDRLLADDAEAVEECVAFLGAVTVRVWHGRARAVMARRLKHRTLSAPQRERVARGRFSEGFKDQLRLVLRLDPEWAFAAALGVPAGAPEHARRYAAWVLAHEPRRHAEPGSVSSRGGS